MTHPIDIPNNHLRTKVVRLHGLRTSVLQGERSMATAIDLVRLEADVVDAALEHGMPASFAYVDVGHIYAVKIDGYAHRAEVSRYPEASSLPF